MNFQIANFIFFNHVGDKAIICENTADMISKIHELIKEKMYLNTLVILLGI